MKQAISNNKIDPRLLEIEVTESIAMNVNVDVSSRLIEMKKIGMSVAIDDFGTGYSSLSALHKFPIDVVKLDRSFLLSAEKDDNGIALLKMVILLAQKLGLDIVCEGIETNEQLDLLTKLNCDYGQGYIFSRPIPEDEFRNNFLK